MGFPEEFRRKRLAEQILALDDIERAARVEALSDLALLWREPGLDEAVAISVGQTVRALLVQSEAAVVAGLESDDPRLQRMCIQVAGRERFEAAKPVLVRLAGGRPDPVLLADTLAALLSFESDPPLELARANLRHPDPIAASLAVEAAGRWRDLASFGTLCEIVSAAEADGEYETCGLPTQKAIEALAVLATDEAAAFLASKIHHRGPTARRLIHEALLGLGPRILPHLEVALRTGDEDTKILAANLVGLLRDRKGAVLLVEAFDRGQLTHPNARFAAYEALGRIGGLSSLVRLGEGLDDPDDLVLGAVVAALDGLANPAAAEAVGKRLRTGGDLAARLAGAVVAARACGLFEALYAETCTFDPLVEALAASRDADTVGEFRKRLEGMDGARAAAVAERLKDVRAAAPRARVLAVDDSRSMLLFYRAALSERGVEVATASSGAEALALLEGGEVFDLVLTDLNMPEMDGVELTRKVRENLFLSAVPVVMATTESEHSQQEAARRAGVSDFLRKPMTADALCAAVGRHLSSEP